MTTSLKEERDEQRRWTLRPAHAGSRVFDRLVENEFADPALLAAATATLLRRMIAHAVETVPYYRRLFRRLKLAPADIVTPADLPRLPVLGKRDLARSREGLRSRALPEGDRIEGWFASSGTTGQPTRVLHSAASNLMFTYLAQRQYRWFRFDPLGRLAIIRPPHSLPPRADGKKRGDDASGRRTSWRYAGTFFQTGPLVFLSANTPVERQLAWLGRTQPDYLMSYAETLEHLALACDGDWRVGSVRATLAIAQQVTPGMRRRVESTMGVPVHQAYGLNEIGLVAARCAAGRYHVHAEHCIVEIVDGNGAPVPAGTTGRILVTGLKNPAMPLLRYDTGDLAEAVAGPCACGRTLPAFGEIAGRYGRMAYLPEGTAPLVRHFRDTVTRLPAAALAGLRQYQLHQFRDGGFELRLVTSGALPPKLAATMSEAWRHAGGTSAALRIVGVDTIPVPPGGKFQDFTSDFVPTAESRERESEPQRHRGTET